MNIREKALEELINLNVELTTVSSSIRTGDLQPHFGRNETFEEAKNEVNDHLMIKKYHRLKERYLNALDAYFEQCFGL